MLPPEDLVSPASVVNTQRNCEDLMEKTKELQAQRDQLAEQLSETRDKLASVTADSGRLRGIVFERLKEQEKSDQEIREAFTGLQQKIQKISMSGEIDIKKISKLGKPEDMQSWENLSGGERKNRIRGGVFNLLQRYILDYPCFGLEGFSIKDDVQERVGLTFNDFELAFINFERVLKELKREFEPIVLQAHKQVPDLVHSEQHGHLGMADRHPKMRRPAEEPRSNE